MRTEIVSFDTNLVVRLLITQDIPAQSKAIVRIVEACQRIRLADTTVVETVFVLTRYYRLPRPAIAKFFLELIDDPKFSCNKNLFISAFDLFVKHPALSFEDCCLALYAHLENAEPLLTFDRKLAKQLPYAQLLTI